MVAGGRVTVVGSANLDLVTVTETLPRPGETLLATSYSEGPGGKGSNQAHAAARMGAAVSFVGLRGDDEAGQILADALSAEGVDVSTFSVTDGPSGRALVMVDEAAENSIIVVAGSNAKLSAADIERAGDVVRSADVVVCQLEIPLGAVQAARKACTGTFVLNPAPAQVLPEDLLAGTDVLVVNETEYETVLGIPLPERLDDIADVAARPGAPKVIVATLGPRGAAVCTDGAVTLITPPEVTVVDSTGAGDTFVGALAAELARGSDVLAAARMAVVAASLSTQSLGATAGMPHRHEVVPHLALSKCPEPA
ncbi:MAG TPA: ribokinase [Propionibacteriaceae bacterium]